MADLLPWEPSRNWFQEYPDFGREVLMQMERWLDTQSLMSRTSDGWTCQFDGDVEVARRLEWTKFCNRKRRSELLVIPGYKIPADWQLRIFGGVLATPMANYERDMAMKFNPSRMARMKRPDTLEGLRDIREEVFREVRDSFDGGALPDYRRIYRIAEAAARATEGAIEYLRHVLHDMIDNLPWGGSWSGDLELCDVDSSDYPPEGFEAIEIDVGIAFCHVASLAAMYADGIVLRRENKGEAWELMPPKKASRYIRKYGLA